VRALAGWLERARKARRKGKGGGECRAGGKSSAPRNVFGLSACTPGNKTAGQFIGFSTKSLAFAAIHEAQKMDLLLSSSDEMHLQLLASSDRGQNEAAGEKMPRQPVIDVNFTSQFQITPKNFGINFLFWAQKERLN